MTIKAGMAGISQIRPIVRLTPQGGGKEQRTLPSSTPSNVNAPGRPRVGLLGGSFNPAHEGHRAISLEALKRLGLDQVWWLVSPQNPLKSRLGMADLSMRMTKAKAISRTDPGIVVTDLEQRIGTQYSVDTVRHLKRRGQADFVWLMGADNLLQLPKWRDWREFINLVPIAVFDREPYSYKALAGPAAVMLGDCRLDSRHALDAARLDPPVWVYFRLRRHRVSSTAIRRRQGWPAGREHGALTPTRSGTTEDRSS